MTHRSARAPAMLTLTVGCLLLTACGTTATPSVSTGTTVTTSAESPGAGTGAAAPPSPVLPTAAPVTSERAPATAAPAPKAPGQGTTACGLITEQEAATALGTDPGPGQETPLGETASACSYLSGTSSVQLSLTPTGGKAAYDHERAGIPAGTTGITEVSGVGDSAFSQIAGARAAINFNKGDALVVIGLTINGSTPSQNQLTTLATAAAGRI